MGDHYVINEAKAVSQTLEGETIIINLEKGSYYSLNTTGSDIWDLVSAGHLLESVVQHISDRYGLTHDEASSEVRNFISLLEQEDLLIRTESVPLSALSPVTKSSEPFVRPSFERYDDMQEMLLADPIHDVGETGWPVLKKEEHV